MYKKLSILFVMLLVATTFAIAQDSTATKADDTAAQGQVVKGTVQAVDTAEKKITIKQDSKTADDVYSYDEKTTFWNGKDEAILIGDIKPGTKVEVTIDAMNNATKVKLAPKDMASETH